MNNSKGFGEKECRQYRSYVVNIWVCFGFAVNVNLINFSFMLGDLILNACEGYDSRHMWI
jgi:hypothetical protein